MSIASLPSTPSAPSGISLAIEQARNALQSGNHPYGAVVIRGSEVIAEAHNVVAATNDPSAHAEVMALRRACEKLGTYDLRGCSLYSTCEPCAMCYGAAMWSRVDSIFYGAQDPEFGALSATVSSAFLPRMRFTRDAECERLAVEAKGLWQDCSWVPPADLVASETASTAREMGGEPAAVSLFERQLRVVETSGNAILTLSGVLIAITTASALSSSPTPLELRVTVALGSLLALAASVAVVWGVFRFKWASLELTPEPGERLQALMARRLVAIRNRKTRSLNLAAYLLCGSLGVYTCAIVRALLGG